ncbi:hypothetical protein MSG41_27210 [Escherichia coli]|nr:hypothetical protein [Escherichia coli]
MFAGKKSAQIREILISESAWEEMTCLFAPSLEWIFLTLIIIFASAISIQQYNEANFVSELNYPMFISAIYGLSLAWFPFPIAYVVLRFLLDDLQHEYPKQ